VNRKVEVLPGGDDICQTTLLTGVDVFGACGYVFPVSRFLQSFLLYSICSVECGLVDSLSYAGAVSDGADLHEPLSVSGWYRRPSAITGWLGIHHVVHSRTFTGISNSKILKTRRVKCRTEVT
jgi:hypothetical protein